MKLFFDKNEKVDMNRIYQCTGTEYLDNIPDLFLHTKESLHKRIKKLIKETYEFYVYQELSNLITKIHMDFISYVPIGPTQCL